MANPVEHTKKHIFLTKTLSILFFILLIICLIIPIQHARLNTQQEYRELFHYKKQAGNYYRAMHSALLNIDMISVDLTTALRTLPSAFNVPADRTATLQVSSHTAPQASFVAFASLSRSSELLDTQKQLSRLVSSTFQTLQTIPDPGNGDIVDAVNDSYHAYLEYRNLLLSAEYDTDVFLVSVEKAYHKAHSAEKKLHSLLS